MPRTISVALLAVAVLIGVVLLQIVDQDAKRPRSRPGPSVTTQR